jgi:hypothetical protein
MAASAAKTVTEYLASLPPERRKEMGAVRKLVKAHLPKGYKEVMNWGMICWEVPASRYPRLHNRQPLCYAALAAQKQYYSLYLTGAYMFPEQSAAIKVAFKEAGKRPDMGKCCVRFKAADDLPLAALGEVIAAIPPGMLILRYEELVKGRGR